MLTATIQPAFADCDGFRHINNTVLPRWFELGRMPLYRYFSPELDHEQLPLIIARLSVDFAAPMALPHEVEIRTWVQRIGTASFTVTQEAWQQGRCCARGETVIVHYDFATERSQPLPEDKRALLNQHLRQESPALP